MRLFMLGNRVKKYVKKILTNIQCHAMYYKRYGTYFINIK